MVNDLTESDIKILHTIQQDFPVCHQPFKTLSSKLNIIEDEVLNRIKALKKQGIIRRITPLFDSSKLGYVGTLIAMKVPDERINEVAKIIDKYPEITHNYEREGEYNIWFTLIAKSKEEIEKIIAQIKTKSKIEQILNLKKMNKFKIAAVFKIEHPVSHHLNPLPAGNSEEEVKYEIFDFQPQETFSPDALDKAILKELQESIPLVDKPYQSIAQKIGIDEKRLFEKIKWYKKTGIIRKVRAVLNHYKVGMEENVMVVFKVEPADMLKLAKIMSQYPQVTHCYERATSVDWQYNLFAMIHGRSKQECEKIISSILQKTNLTIYKKLYTKRELKKANPGYF